MAEIILNHLTKTYPTASGQSVTVVRGIDLAIKDREFMVLVGPSGCGKSTTLRMIAGLEDISGGTITIGDRVVNDIAPKDRDIAMVFQNYALYPHMSVYDNMAFGLTLRKMPKPEIKRRVNEAAAMLGLTDYLGRKPKDLSGGQRQRVAVGRAIVRQPKVFLFDEPLSNLDAKMRGTMRGELARLHARLDATMVYVTHDQVEAMTMGDRICVMHDGAIMQVATPLELYEHPANLFVAGFIGSPPMNLFTGIVRTIGGVLVFTETGAHAKPLVLPLPAECSRRAQPYLDRPVTLGLRPEHLSESGGPEKVPLNATVELVEPMGADTTVHLTTGATSFIARVQPATRLALGQAVTLHLDLAHAHLFDASTGQALA